MLLSAVDKSPVTARSHRHQAIAASRCFHRYRCLLELQPTARRGFRRPPVDCVCRPSHYLHGFRRNAGRLFLACVVVFLASTSDKAAANRIKSKPKAADKVIAENVGVPHESDEPDRLLGVHNVVFFLKELKTQVCAFEERVLTYCNGADGKLPAPDASRVNGWGNSTVWRCMEMAYSSLVRRELGFYRNYRCKAPTRRAPKPPPRMTFNPGLLTAPVNVWPLHIEAGLHDVRLVGRH